MAKRSFEISKRIIGGILVLDIKSKPTTEDDSTSVLASNLFQVIQDSNCQQVLLDLQGIEFITSDVIGQLIMLHKKCVADNRQLKICGATAENRLALDLVRFDTLVEMYERKPHAITAFKMGERKPLEVEVDEGAAAEYEERAKAGDLDAQFEAGEFGPLLQWLTTKVYNQGMRYYSNDLSMVITGTPLSHEPLIGHLTRKYETLYGI